MGWLDPTVSVPRVTYGRLKAIAAEVVFLKRDYYPNERELLEYTEELIEQILNEYVRQHFDESTKAAATMILRKKKQKERLLD